MQDKGRGGGGGQGRQNISVYIMYSGKKEDYIGDHHQRTHPTFLDSGSGTRVDDRIGVASICTSSPTKFSSCVALAGELSWRNRKQIPSAKNVLAVPDAVNSAVRQLSWHTPPAPLLSCQGPMLRNCRDMTEDGGKHTVRQEYCQLSGMQYESPVV